MLDNTANGTRKAIEDYDAWMPRHIHYEATLCQVSTTVKELIRIGRLSDSPEDHMFHERLQVDLKVLCLSAYSQAECIPEEKGCNF